MTEGPREALFEIYTWILCLSYLHENKQAEFNPYIYTLSKSSRFGYDISVFKYTTGRYTYSTAAGAAGSYVTYVSSWKNGCQKFFVCLS